MEALLVKAILAAIGGGTVYAVYLVVLGIWHVLFSKNKEALLDQPPLDHHKVTATVLDIKNTPVVTRYAPVSVGARVSLSNGRSIQESRRRLGLKPDASLSYWAKLINRAAVVTIVVGVLTLVVVKIL